LNNIGSKNLNVAFYEIILAAIPKAIKTLKIEPNSANTCPIRGN
jgi:hypothetical protein